MSVVSVIVPCYNADASIAAALESALAQDVSVEVLVIDDGSTDNSLAIAREFEPRVRVVSGANRGVSLARNTGIAETGSEWVVFLDADDMLEPNTLAQRIATAKAKAASVVISDWQEMHDDGFGRLVVGAHKNIDWQAIEADAEVATATSVWATTSAILYNRAIVEKIGGFRRDLPIIQDARFLFDAAYNGARFAHFPHVGARYRVSSKSLSRRAPVQFWHDVLTNGTQIETLWRARGVLSPQQSVALAGIYDAAARGLFEAESMDYFKAVTQQHALKHPVPIHPRIAAPLARAVGLRRARQIFSWVGR